jgi:SAM-dependent methyltransferase
MLVSVNARIKAALQPERQRWVSRLRRPAWMGTLRRLTPLSDNWGLERGTPVDRYYIDRFLMSRRSRINGRVIEVRDDRYAKRFGSADNTVDILDIDASNPNATIVTDLCSAECIPSETFDCFILTQTLHHIWDHQAAVNEVWRILRPGGSVLCTVPSVSRVAPRHASDDFWRYTPAACRALFSERFKEAAVAVETYGNALSAVAFLMGMAAEELTPDELDAADPYHPVLIAICAVKQ